MGWFNLNLAGTGMNVDFTLSYQGAPIRYLRQIPLSTPPSWPGLLMPTMVIRVPAPAVPHLASALAIMVRMHCSASWHCLEELGTNLH